MELMTVIAGAKVAVAGVDLALDAAEGAAKRIRRAMEVGSEFADIAHDVRAFFSAQGEAEEAQRRSDEEARSAKTRGDTPPRKDVLTEAFDNVMRVRQLRQFETELREWMIWSGNGDLYQELMAERKRIAEEREKERLDALKAAKLAEEKARRRVAQRRQRALDAIAAIMGVVAGSAVIYGIWWMFTFHDRI